MLKSIVRYLSMLGLSLVLTAGLMVGCGTDTTDSPVTQAAKKQVEKQSKKDPHHDESSHKKEGHEKHQEHERPEHFKGKKANSYDEAVSNMKTANSRLKKLLAQGELAGTDFFKIHRMSYTMENALAVIRKQSDGNYEDVAQSLEAVHLASEKRDAQTVRQEGKEYLRGARAMLKTEN